MAHRTKGAFWLVSENGYHALYTPEGEEVRFMVCTTVTDVAGEPASCTAQFIVNIASTEEEMRKGIERLNNPDNVYLTVGEGNKISRKKLDWEND